MGSVLKMALPIAGVAAPFMFPGLGAAMGLGAAGTGASALAGATGPELLLGGAAGMSPFGAAPLAGAVSGGLSAVQGANMLQNGLMAGFSNPFTRGGGISELLGNFDPGMLADLMGDQQPQQQPPPPMVMPQMPHPPPPETGGSLVDAASRPSGAVPLNTADVFSPTPLPPLENPNADAQEAYIQYLLNAQALNNRRRDINTRRISTMGP